MKAGAMAKVIAVTGVLVTLAAGVGTRADTAQQRFTISGSFTTGGSYYQMSLSVTRRVAVTAPLAVTSPVLNVSLYSYSGGVSCSDAYALGPTDLVTDGLTMATLTTTAPHCGKVMATWSSASAPIVSLDESRHLSGCGGNNVGYCLTWSETVTTGSQAVVSGGIGDVQFQSPNVYASMGQEAGEGFQVSV